MINAFSFLKEIKITPNTPIRVKLADHNNGYYYLNNNIKFIRNYINNTFETLNIPSTNRYLKNNKIPFIERRQFLLIPEKYVELFNPNDIDEIKITPNNPRIELIRYFKRSGEFYDYKLTIENDSLWFLYRNGEFISRPNRNLKNILKFLDNKNIDYKLYSTFMVIPEKYIKINNHNINENLDTLEEGHELFEIKTANIKVGQIFTLGAPLGKFKKGERIIVRKILPNGDDYAITFKNKSRFVDTFYIDKDEDVFELEPVDEIARMQKLAGIVNEAPDEPINNLPEPDPEIPRIPEPEPPLEPGPNTPQGATINHAQAKAIIKQSKGKIFSVTFTKRGDGSVRTMIARLGVTQYLKGGSLAYDPEEKGLIPVYDMTVKGYRMIPVDSITSLRIGKFLYDVR